MSCKGNCKKADLKNKLGIDIDQLKDFGGSQAARVAELAAAAGLGNLIARPSDDEEDEKKSHVGLIILAIIGVIAIGCLIGYVIYHDYDDNSKEIGLSRGLR